MIITLRSISYEELKNQLSKNDKIVINSCNTCIVSCGVGGMDNMKLLERMLTADGYNILGKDLISIGCNLSLLKAHKEDMTKKEMYEEADVIIPLICENGLQGIKATFPDKKIIQVGRTVGTGFLTADEGIVLSQPFADIPMEQNDEGYGFDEVAEKLGLYSEFFDEYDAPEHEPELVNINVDGEEIDAVNGANLLQTLLSNGFEIPHLCYNEELQEAGVCRLCLVKIEGMKGLVPSCCTYVKKDMIVTTDDEELHLYKKTILELVLASNEHNCLTCDKGVASPMYSCTLQALMRKYNVDTTRFIRNKESEEIDDTSPVIRYDPNKCILCGQCVRACEEIAGRCNLGFINRGSETRVAAGFNVDMDQSSCVACMACTNVCPTGALTEKYIKFSGKEFSSERKFPSFEG